MPGVVLSSQVVDSVLFGGYGLFGVVPVETEEEAGLVSVLFGGYGTLGVVPEETGCVAG